jgi:hypothetical protein
MFSLTSLKPRFRTDTRHLIPQIEDLKCYFEDHETHEEEDLQGEDMEMPDMLFSRKTPGNKSELIAQLPERKVADRLVTRYFGSMCPSQRMVHLCNEKMVVADRVTRYRAPPYLHKRGQSHTHSHIAYGWSWEKTTALIQ